MQLLIATTNPGKLREIREVMRSSTLDIIGLSDLDKRIDEPEEDGDTFEANAIKKAKHYAEASGILTLADDSGLEVDALRGEPGVHSAYYAGTEGGRETRDPANNRKLLDALQNVPKDERTARFVCVMALSTPKDMHFADNPATEIMTERGTIEGRIITPEEAADPRHPERGRGTNGFGYDPLFFVPELGKTTAELSPQEKNEVSHRGKATQAMWLKIHNLVEAPQA